ncbi:MAG: PQQ-binding-like beta-propeller repeat protein [Halioglobus sp.]
MKKLLLATTVLLSGLLLAGAVSLLLMESPGKTLESLALRHADKLPLAYIGEVLFDRHCASCHDNPATHSPTREALTGFSKETIMVALEFGKMQLMANHLSRQEKGLIAIYLAGQAPAPEWIADHSCSDEAKDSTTPYIGNWGMGGHNQRHMPNQLAGINKDNVASLELAWSLAFPQVSDMRSQPAIVGDTLFFGDKTGKLYAIDRHTGCIRQHVELLSGIRSAITVVPRPGLSSVLVFADSLATVYALDAGSLETLWQAPTQLFDTSVITGSISYYENQLFVPISSYEVAVTGSPGYICCKSHGGVIALDAADGERLWTWHATEEASLQGKNSAGDPRYGPSGVSVWSTPTIDPKRRRIYIGTGENLSHPDTDTSDAVIALDMDNGELVWQFQATQADVWNAACLNGGANCPTDPGGDFDFGASVILAQLPNGEDLLLAGQKSGDVYALDPSTTGRDGKVLWHTRVSNAGIGPDLHRTTTNGGVHWGMSVSGQQLLVAAADPERDRPGYTPQPGLQALNLADGSQLWHQPVERGCHIAEENKPLVGLQNMNSSKKIDLQTQYACSFYYGLSAAVTSTDELVFSGGLDGRVRAYDIASGNVLWQTDTARAFTASNGIEGHGGAIDVSGQVLADGWLYVQSGYSMFGQLPGNMLLAFKVSSDGLEDSLN